MGFKGTPRKKPLAVIEAKFWGEVRRTDTCWFYRKPVGKGYAQVNVHGRTMWAHRFAYLASKGEIPAGLTIDHLCRNRACVNPEHLEAVPNRTNVLRGVGLAAKNAAKTHCLKGHKFTPENTRIDPRGKRVCRACVREDCRTRRALGLKA